MCLCACRGPRGRSRVASRYNGCKTAPAMPDRPQERRPKDFKPGEVTGWRPGVDCAPLVERAHYIPDGKHKNYPAPNGEWTLCTRPEGTRCPTIPPEKWRHLQTHLRCAMASGAVQFHPEDDSEFPARV